VVNDTIADMLTRIRNAVLAKHKIVQIPATKMTRSIITALKHEGFIKEFDEVENKIASCLMVTLKYKGKNKSPVITKIKRISRPGLRIYSGHKELPKVLGGIGIAIMSTPKGIMTNKEAKYHGLGGEILCYIW
jgi:small subunit ribosomal protein S8